MTTLTRPQLASSEIPDLNTVTWPKYIQPKYDGICCLAVNGVAMSRTMKSIPNKFIQKFFADNALHGFHGELMGPGDFNDVQSAVMSIDGEPDFYYAVYDLWDHEGTYEQRFWDLTNLVYHDTELFWEAHITVAPTHLVCDVEGAMAWAGAHIEQGFEGSMLRCPRSLYKQGRHTLKSQALMKLKTFHDDEAVIIGFEERMTNTNEQERDERGYAKRSSKKEGLVGDGTLGALMVMWKGVEFKIGSGYTEDQRAELWNRRNKLTGALVTFKYQEVSSKGVPRFPVYKCVVIPMDEY